MDESFSHTVKITKKESDLLMEKRLTKINFEGRVGLALRYVDLLDSDIALEILRKTERHSLTNTQRNLLENALDKANKRNHLNDE